MKLLSLLLLSPILMLSATFAHGQTYFSVWDAPSIGVIAKACFTPPSDQSVTVTNWNATLRDPGQGNYIQIYDSDEPTKVIWSDVMLAPTSTGIDRLSGATSKPDAVNSSMTLAPGHTVCIKFAGGNTATGNQAVGMSGSYQ
jgi:hypothetical protein